MTPYIARKLRQEPNIWDDACGLTLVRHNHLSTPSYSGVPLDSGVNYFVLQLERMGCETVFSCEGHPTGFYVSFVGSYPIARKLAEVGYFGVEVDRHPNWFVIRCKTISDNKSRTMTMRLAAEAWEKAFGPLDLVAASTEAIDKPFSMGDF